MNGEREREAPWEEDVCALCCSRRSYWEELEVVTTQRSTVVEGTNEMSVIGRRQKSVPENDLAGIEFS